MSILLFEALFQRHQVLEATQFVNNNNIMMTLKWLPHAMVKLPLAQNCNEKGLRHTRAKEVKTTVHKHVLHL